MAEIFAHNVARLWESLGGSALVSSYALPSPLLAWRTRQHKAALGIMLTASHNPPQYLGIKLKEHYGGSATSETQAEVARLASSLEPPDIDFEPRYLHGALFNPVEHYSDSIASAFRGVDSRTDKRPSPRIVVDFMNGVAANIAPDIFSARGIDAEYLRTERDPTFGGVGPEPVQARLGELSRRTASLGGRVIGMAFDGDGDRLTAMDETGDCLGSHELYTIFLEHLVRIRGAQGRAVGSFSFSTIVDKAAQKLGVEMTRVPVGYKAVAEEFLKGDVMIGGEESGGTGFGFWLPERDALAMALMLCEAVSIAGKPLSEMRRDLARSYGDYAFQSRNIRLSKAPRYDELDLAIAKANHYLGARRIERIDSLDGRKLWLEGGAWVLIRRSGTEPLVRIYTESGDSEQTRQLLDETEAFVRRVADRNQMA